MPTDTVTHVQPIEAASGDHKGETFVINPNEIFAVDDELVRAYPHLFQPLRETRQRPEVEQATAAPGEHRGDAPKPARARARRR